MSDRPTRPGTNDRLESWKAIANYLQREVRTVQRWEREESLPVHRHEHNKQATVYAYRAEIDRWRATRDQTGLARKSSRRKSRSTLLGLLAIVGVVILTAAIWFSRTDEIPGSGVHQQLIVVLPFEDLSREPLDPLADALVEEISAQLSSAVPDRLAVIARTSARSLKNNQLSIEEIRTRLNVDYVLAGSIRVNADSVRITAELVNTASQSQLWAESFDYEIGNWLDLQSKAANDVVRQLSEVLEFAVTPEATVEKTHAEAYEHVLLGWHYFDQFGPATLGLAIQQFETANGLDPEFADAHVGLALSHAARAFYGIAPARLAYQEAQRWAVSALKLEPENGEPLAVLGWVDFAYYWQWSIAEDRMREALEKQPNSIWTRWILANFLSAMNRPEEAIEMIESAARLDPASPYVLIAKGYILTNAGNYSASIDHWLAIRAWPGITVPGGFFAQAYEGAGEFDAAIRLYENGRTGGADIRAAYSAEGERGYWRVMAERQARFLSQYPDSFSYRYAVVLSKLGELDLAIDTLERGYHQRDPTMIFLLVYPLETLYDEPRFQALLVKMNLPFDRAAAAGDQFGRY